MPRAPHRAGRRRAPIGRMIRGGSVAAGAATGIAAAVLWPLRGAVAAASALGAGAVVTLAFAIGVGALALVVAGPGAVARMSLLGAFVVYAGQLIALTALALALRDVEVIDRVGVAVGGIAACLAWQVGQIRGFTTSRALVFGGAVR
ncbi:hypothetical protein [Agilicoccus flavus]|uniref:hypothetical protein n=1 Tax=Agilicoccus flavus TaxID=2775968 RepID=UPI001CF657ED|nr:hypothetical protein [Agilicoccus flavus]